MAVLQPVTISADTINEWNSPCIHRFTKNVSKKLQEVQYENIFYEVDPLLCPKCHGAMRVIAFIEEQPVIKKILSHLGLWQTHNHDPPRARADPIPTFESEFTIDTTCSQLPPIDYWDL